MDKNLHSLVFSPYISHKLASFSSTSLRLVGSAGFPGKEARRKRTKQVILIPVRVRRPLKSAEWKATGRFQIDFKRRIRVGSGSLEKLPVGRGQSLPILIRGRFI